MAKRNGSTAHQFMAVANVLVTNGDFMDKRQILESCVGTGIVENRLSTYLWECKAHGGNLVKEKRAGVPKWKMTVLPTPPEFNARKASAPKAPPKKKVVAPKISAAELVKILKEDDSATVTVSEDTVAADLPEVLEAAAKPAAPRRGRRKSAEAVETVAETAKVEEDVVEVSDDEGRTSELLAALNNND